MKKLLLILLVGFFAVSCGNKAEELPKYGQTAVPGEYTNQDGELVNAETLKGKVYVTDFVFTHCPSICPRMAKQMLRVQEEFKGNENLKLVSFSVDPERDTVERLKWYTNKMGVDTKMWNYVRAEEDVIKATSSKLKVFQEADENAPGGFNHQSRMILVDQNGEVRGYYDGINPEDVDRLIADLHKLL